MVLFPAPCYSQITKAAEYLMKRTMDMEIGKTIKALRSQKRVTQEQTAAHLGATRQSVSNWENGLSVPDVTLLPAIAAWFGVTIDEAVPDARRGPLRAGGEPSGGRPL